MRCFRSERLSALDGDRVRFLNFEYYQNSYSFQVHLIRSQVYFLPLDSGLALAGDMPANPIGW
jgi:hypothetical protein